MGNMNNDNRKEARDFTSEGLLEQLTDTAIPIPLKGVIFKDTTPNLSSKIVDLIATTYGIPEVDHCYICPETDNQGRVVSMGAVLYFNPDYNGGNITRPKGASKKGGIRLDDGSADLRGLVSNKVVTGGFHISEKFKKYIAPIAILNDDGDIVIRATRNGGMAMVDIDFFKMIAVVLKIDPDSNLDFEVTELEPIGKNNSIDYSISITKYVTPQRKKSKRGINYDDLDREYSNKRGRRR